MLKLKVGDLVKNKLGQFTKVVALKSGFVYFNGWHLKKETAEKVEGTNGNSPVNERGFASAMGVDLETAEPTTEVTEPEVTETETVEETTTETAPAKGKGKGK